MQPTDFPEANALFGRDQKEYLPLPALRKESEPGEVVSCWKATWRERLLILVTGRVWLGVLTFGRPLQPQRLTARKREVVPPWYGKWLRRRGPGGNELEAGSCRK